MKFSLIICTYQRHVALSRLLESVKQQIIYPEQILVIDGSNDSKTGLFLDKNSFTNLEYFLVDDNNRGLTRQRNFGISRLDTDVDIVFFLDDDTVLQPDYFEKLLKTYLDFPDALGVSGFIRNESEWKKVPPNYKKEKNKYLFDSWIRTEGSRFLLRRKFGLQPDLPPGHMPTFSHGYPTGFLPPSGKTYEVEFFMGCSMSFRKRLFDELSFSSFFDGYGLYEDMDFCLRVAKRGKLYVNTLAQLDHYHDPAGRPRPYKYGKMVLQNGWYVWRTKFPNPKLTDVFKWHSTALLLTLVRTGNVISSKEKKVVFRESMGRFIGWWELVFSAPQFELKDKVEK